MKASHISSEMRLCVITCINNTRARTQTHSNIFLFNRLAEQHLVLVTNWQQSERFASRSWCVVGWRSWGQEKCLILPNPVINIGKWTCYLSSVIQRDRKYKSRIQYRSSSTKLYTSNHRRLVVFKNGEANMVDTPQKENKKIRNHYTSQIIMNAKILTCQT